MARISTLIGARRAGVEGIENGKELVGEEAPVKGRGQQIRHSMRGGHVL